MGERLCIDQRLAACIFLNYFPLFCLFDTEFHSVAQASLELTKYLLSAGFISVSYSTQLTVNLAKNDNHPNDLAQGSVF